MLQAVVLPIAAALVRAAVFVTELIIFASLPQLQPQPLPQHALEIVLVHIGVIQVAINGLPHSLVQVIPVFKEVLLLQVIRQSAMELEVFPVLLFPHHLLLPAYRQHLLATQLIQQFHKPLLIGAQLLIRLLMIYIGLPAAKAQHQQVILFPIATHHAQVVREDAVFPMEGL